MGHIKNNMAQYVLIQSEMHFSSIINTSVFASKTPAALVPSGKLYKILTNRPVKLLCLLFSISSLDTPEVVSGCTQTARCYNMRSIKTTPNVLLKGSHLYYSPGDRQLFSHYLNRT